MRHNKTRNNKNCQYRQKWITSLIKSAVFNERPLECYITEKLFNDAKVNENCHVKIYFGCTGKLAGKLREIHAASACNSSKTRVLY